MFYLAKAGPWIYELGHEREMGTLLQPYLFSCIHNPMLLKKQTAQFSSQSKHCGFCQAKCLWRNESIHTKFKAVFGQ